MRPQRATLTHLRTDVSGELKKHFRDRAWGVHVVRRVQDLCLDAMAARTTLTGMLCREPTTAEIADHLDVAIEELVLSCESIDVL